MKNKIRIAIYSRKSKYSDKGDSIGNQIELAEGYINSHYSKELYDVEIIVFEDEGYSGKSFERPQFKVFLEQERSNPFNVLICYRLDRISRNIADFSGLMNELSKLKTSFVSIKEQFDTSTPMGRAMMYIASVFAQLEREVIAERIRDNLLELSKTGVWLGGDTPLGYRSEKYEKVQICEEKNNVLEKKSKKACKLIIHNEEIKILLLIYHKYLKLKSLSKLETYLMQNNIKTRKGVYYSIFTLKWILTNPCYAKNDEDTVEYFNNKNIHLYVENDDRNKFDGQYGFLTFNKSSNKKANPISKWIIAVGLHKGVIEGKKWVEVQYLLEKNSSKSYRAISNPKKQTLVTGLIKCKECGSNMRPRNMGDRRKDGTVLYSYYCELKEKSRMQKCKGKNINGEEIDTRIVELIKNTFVPNSEIYKALKDMTIINTSYEKEELEILQDNYEKNNIEIERMVEKMKYIDIDLMDMINNNLHRLKKKKLELEEKMSKFSNKSVKIKCNKTTEIVKDILTIINNSFNAFECFDLKTKRDIIGIFVKSITGNGDNVTVDLLNTKSEREKEKNTCQQKI